MKLSKNEEGFKNQRFLNRLEKQSFSKSLENVSFLKKIILMLILAILIIGCAKEEIEKLGDEIKLPKPRYESTTSIEAAIKERSSIRSFKDEELSLNDISQLLWAAYGIDAVTGATRKVPSAGATYPLEIYLVVKNVDNLEEGVYHYNPEKHSVIKMSDKKIDYNGAIFLVFTAVYERTTSVYGNRGIMYVHMEAGHSAQNVYLQANSLGLGAYVIGAFDDNNVIKKLELAENNVPLYIMPIGKI